jgi:hypothetical protein
MVVSTKENVEAKKCDGWFKMVAGCGFNGSARANI